MSSIIDIVQQQLSGGGTQQIAQRVGVDPATVQKAVNAALPMIIGSLGQHTATADTVQSGNAGNLPNAAALLGGLSGMFGGQDAGGLLGKIMGGRQDDVHNAAAKAAGIDKGKAMQIVEMIIPMVMSALANRNQQTQQPRPNTAEPRPGA